MKDNVVSTTIPILFWSQESIAFGYRSILNEYHFVFDKSSHHLDRQDENKVLSESSDHDESNSNINNAASLNLVSTSASSLLIANSFRRKNINNNALRITDSAITQQSTCFIPQLMKYVTLIGSGEHILFLSLAQPSSLTHQSSSSSSLEDDKDIELTPTMIVIPSITMSIPAERICFIIPSQFENGSPSICAVSSSGTIFIISPEDGACSAIGRNIISAAGTPRIGCIFGTERRYLAVAGTSSTIQVIDLWTMTSSHQLSTHPEHIVSLSDSIGSSSSLTPAPGSTIPDGFYSYSADGTVVLWGWNSTMSMFSSSQKSKVIVPMNSRAFTTPLISTSNQKHLCIIQQGRCGIVLSKSNIDELHSEKSTHMKSLIPGPLGKEWVGSSFIASNILMLWKASIFSPSTAYASTPVDCPIVLYFCDFSSSLPVFTVIAGLTFKREFTAASSSVSYDHATRRVSLVSSTDSQHHFTIWNVSRFVDTLPSHIPQDSSSNELNCIRPLLDTSLGSEVDHNDTIEPPYSIFIRIPGNDVHGLNSTVLNFTGDHEGKISWSSLLDINTKTEIVDNRRKSLGYGSRITCMVSPLWPQLIVEITNDTSINGFVHHALLFVGHENGIVSVWEISFASGVVCHTTLLFDWKVHNCPVTSFSFAPLQPSVAQPLNGQRKAVPETKIMFCSTSMNGEVVVFGLKRQLNDSRSSNTSSALTGVASPSHLHFMWKGLCLHRFSGHQGNIRSVSWDFFSSRSGLLLVHCDLTYIWNLRSGFLERRCTTEASLQATEDCDSRLPSPNSIAASAGSRTPRKVSRVSKGSISIHHLPLSNTEKIFIPSTTNPYWPHSHLSQQNITNAVGNAQSVYRTSSPYTGSEDLQATRIFSPSTAPLYIQSFPNLRFRNQKHSGPLVSSINIRIGQATETIQKVFSFENADADSSAGVNLALSGLLSFLHEWNVDGELDKACAKVFGISPDRSSKLASFGLNGPLTSFGCSSLFLPSYGRDDKFSPRWAISCRVSAVQNLAIVSLLVSAIQSAKSDQLRIFFRKLIDYYDRIFPGVFRQIVHQSPIKHVHLGLNHLHYFHESSLPILAHFSMDENPIIQFSASILLRGIMERLSAQSKSTLAGEWSTKMNHLYKDLVTFLETPHADSNFGLMAATFIPQRGLVSARPHFSQSGTLHIDDAPNSSSSSSSSQPSKSVLNATASSFDPKLRKLKQTFIMQSEYQQTVLMLALICVSHLSELPSTTAGYVADAIAESLAIAASNALIEASVQSKPSFTNPNLMRSSSEASPATPPPVEAKASFSDPMSQITRSSSDGQKRTEASASTTPGYNSNNDNNLFPQTRQGRATPARPFSAVLEGQNIEERDIIPFTPISQERSASVGQTRSAFAKKVTNSSSYLTEHGSKNRKMSVAFVADMASQGFTIWRPYYSNAVLTDLIRSLLVLAGGALSLDSETEQRRQIQQQKNSLARSTTPDQRQGIGLETQLSSSSLEDSQLPALSSQQMMDDMMADVQSTEMSEAAACKRALLEVAAANPQIFIRTIGAEAVRADMNHAHHVTAVSALVHVVKRYPHLLVRHLHGVVEVIIKTLDPNEPTLRKAVLPASTYALQELVRKFPMISVSPKSQRFAVGTSDSVVIIYDLRTASKWRILEGSKGPISAVAFEKDGNGDRIVTYCATDNAVKAWYAGSSGFFGGMMGIKGRCVSTLNLPPIGSIGAGVSDLDILRECRIEWGAKTAQGDQVRLRRENGKTDTLTIPAGSY